MRARCLPKARSMKSLQTNASWKSIWDADVVPRKHRRRKKLMLEAKTIDLHYGAAQALRAVSLKAEPGKVNCVLGRNGVAKTSLLDALAGHLPVSSGKIIWEGNDITALRPPE